MRNFGAGLIAAILLTASILTNSQSFGGEDLIAFRFDMGSDESPLMEGFQRITADTGYSTDRGFGWGKTPAGAVDSTDATFVEWGGEKKFTDYVLCSNALTSDCVNDPDSLVFAVDLPDGDYNVSAWVGNFSTPLSRVSVFANGKPLKEDFDSRTLWQLDMKTQIGASHLVRGEVHIAGGKLRIEVNSDKGAGEEFIEVAVGKEQKLTQKTARMAFSEVALQGLAIHTRVDPPFKMASGKLEYTRSGSDGRSFAEQFNAAAFDKALATARGMNGGEAALAKANALLWLAGRPEVETERELLPESIGLLQSCLGNGANGLAAQELLWEAQLLAECVEAFYGYGYSYTGFGVRQQMGRAEGILSQFDDPASPLHWKAKLYLARLTCILDPLRWAWWYDRGKAMFAEMESAFPDNKWVRLYLDDEWGWPQGQTSEPKIYEGWGVKEYRDGIEGAPAWAVHMREEYARLIDLAEWWIDNRMIENGEIGGGWGDDVELGPLWPFLAMISDGASDRAMAGGRQLIDGVWNSPEIRGGEGYSTIFTWVKPASELVAYSQPLMAIADYGNPRYIERAMLTTKYLRDFATGVNGHGHRHFKSAYLNAVRLGEEPWMKIDSSLCQRPAYGAAALSWYSENPGAVDLMTEWLEAWYEDSLRTDKGKPKLIFPEVIAYETEELGGVGAKTWNDGRREKGLDGSFVWPSYQNYLYDLFTAWHLRTGDAKYMEPAAALVDIARHYLPGADDPFPEGTHPWFEDMIHQGNMEGRFQATSIFNVKMMTGATEYDGYLESLVGGYKKFLFDGNLDELTQGMEKAGRDLRTRWPFLTTEVGLTDRMALPGFQEMYAAITGGDSGAVSRGIPFMAVTYEDTTKNFAAIVREQSNTHLKLWIYSFLPEDREIGIRPWRLEVGGTYALKIGPDANEDGEMDEAGANYQFDFKHRGDSMRFTLPARKLQLVEVAQLKKGTPPPKLVPDLGISDEDVFWLDSGELGVRVHNIGSQAAKNLRVALDAKIGKQTKRIGEIEITNLSAPLQLDPQTKLIGFPVPKELRDASFVVMIDPDDAIYEITERNNVFEFSTNSRASD